MCGMKWRAVCVRPYHQRLPDRHGGRAVTAQIVLEVPQQRVDGLRPHEASLVHREAGAYTRSLLSST